MKWFGFGLLFSVLQTLAQQGDWQTFYEKSGYLETPGYAETIDYCRKLADASPWIEYTSFGSSPQGRELPMLVADKNSNFNPQAVRRSGNIVLLVQACIHAGEPDGKDAGLMFFRDLAINKKLYKLLDHVTVLFIPIFNVDGHERFGKYNRINQNGPEEMGWRTTAQNLNLNRDFLKADSPEMKAWLELFQKWLPDFFVDIHVTDGADYQYAVTYYMETSGNMDTTLTEWTKKLFIPAFKEGMDKSGYPAFPYVAFRKWHDPRSGIINYPGSPRFSQGYTAAQNRIGLLIENHMLKNYKTRVSASYEALKIICDVLDKNYTELKRMNLTADQTVSNPEFREQAFPVDIKTTNDSVMVEFKGFEYEVVKSDLTGGDWFKYSNIPTTFLIPYFGKFEPKATVILPEAYIIPPEWEDVTKRLAWHGIVYSVLKEDTTVRIQSYKFTDVKWGKSSSEGRLSAQATPVLIDDVRRFPAGSVVIDMNQRTARVIAYMLEPSSPDSYVSWGFFNTIFEQKEYFETYVMEDMARKMINENPELKAEFDQRKAANPDFARSQWDMLNWFYSKTPFWDQKLNIYPVGRIVDRNELEQLLK